MDPGPRCDGGPEGGRDDDFPLLLRDELSAPCLVLDFLTCKTRDLTGTCCSGDVVETCNEDSSEGSSTPMVISLMVGMLPLAQPNYFKSKVELTSKLPITL